MRKCCRKRHRRRQSCNTLKDMPGGSTVRIQDLACCPKERCRLLSMGLTPGSTAQVSNNACGSCCLRVRDADIILGDDLAATITVCQISDDAPIS